MSLPEFPSGPPAPQRGTMPDPEFAAAADLFAAWWATLPAQLQAWGLAMVVKAASANFTSVSTTSREIGTGVRTFQIEDGKLLVAGQFVIVASASDPAGKWMFGPVISYDFATGALAVNVAAISGGGSTHADWIVGLSGPMGLSSGAAFTNPVLTGTITEDVFPIVDGPAVAINPEDGSIQTWTLGANRTPTIAMGDGQSVTLMIADGAAYAVNWSSINPTWVGGSAPTLPTSGYAVIELWKVAGTIYAARVGNVA